MVEKNEFVKLWGRLRYSGTLSGYVPQNICSSCNFSLAGRFG